MRKILNGIVFALTMVLAMICFVFALFDRQSKNRKHGRKEVCCPSCGYNTYEDLLICPRCGKELKR